MLDPIRTPRWAAFLAVVAVLLAAQPAHADLRLIPAGLNPGDQFRVAFVSSAGHNALSTDIAVYDQFITGLAVAAGIDTYFGTPVTWQVLGSTGAVSAISRLPLTSPGLYDMLGVKVADSGADLWDRSIDSAILATERPLLFEMFSDLVYTGTLQDGSGSDSRLGGNAGVTTTEIGIASFLFTTFGDWVSVGPVDGSPLRSLYGVSSVLTVPSTTAVPEPASFTLVLVGAAALAGGVAVRRRPWCGARA